MFHEKSKPNKLIAKRGQFLSLTLVIFFSVKLKLSYFVHNMQV